MYYCLAAQYLGLPIQATGKTMPIHIVDLRLSPVLSRQQSTGETKAYDRWPCPHYSRLMKSGSASCADWGKFVTARRCSMQPRSVLDFHWSIPARIGGLCTPPSCSSRCSLQWCRIVAWDVCLQTRLLAIRLLLPLGGSVTDCGNFVFVGVTQHGGHGLCKGLNGYDVVMTSTRARFGILYDLVYW